MMSPVTTILAIHNTLRLAYREFGLKNLQSIADEALPDSLLPGSGMGADRATEALERNLAEVFELEAFAEA